MKKENKYSEYINVYKKYKHYRAALILSGIILTFFTKPGWCDSSSEMDDDCRVNSKTGVKYYNPHIKYVAPVITHGAQAFIMITTTLFYMLKSSYFKDTAERRKKLGLKIALILAFVAGLLFKAKKYELPICHLVYLLFVVVHIKAIRRAWFRAMTIIYKIREIIYLQLSFFLLIGYLIAILTYGINRLIF